MLDRLQRFGDHSSAFLTFNTEMLHYLSSATGGLVAYRDAGRRHTIQLCGPFAQAEDRVELLREFRCWSRGRHRKLTAIQLRRDDAEVYAAEGFLVNQIGSSYSIAAEQFSLRGRRFRGVRNHVSRARRMDVSVDEVRPGVERGRALEGVDREWLATKGRHAAEFAFMIGERGGRGDDYRRIFVARHGGRAVAYVSWAPVYGGRPGWLYDLTRRRPSAPDGAIELIVASALETFFSEGAGWIHLGLTPFACVSAEHEMARATSRILGRMIRRSGSLDFVYPTRSQEAFKRKWGPTLIEPEYVAFDGRPNLGAMLQLARLTRVLSFRRGLAPARPALAEPVGGAAAGAP